MGIWGSKAEPVCPNFVVLKFFLYIIMWPTLQPQKRRPRIDRSMIGNPTDFQHTSHIGTGDTGAAGAVVSSFL